MMRNDDRHKSVRKINTIGEVTLSDHKPKRIKLEITKKRVYHDPKRKKTPRVLWERLRQEEVATNYRAKVAELLEGADEEAGEEEKSGWDEITRIVTTAADEVCGRETKQINDPWMIGRDEEIQNMTTRIAAALERRNNLLVEEREAENRADRERIQGELEDTRNELKEARKLLKRKTKLWETQWWEAIIEDCREANERGDSGVVYKNLRKLGNRGRTKAPETTNITKEEFKIHFQAISKDRFENPPEEVEAAVNEMEDISQSDRAVEWREMLEMTPTAEEVRIQMKQMRESAPGEDGVRLIYLLKGGPTVMNMVVRMIQFMFLNSADKWEKSLKIGEMIPLHKKGNRNIPGNFRGVCLLAMGSRILARILATRLRVWSEKLELLDDDQAGFRAKRSTADITQIFYRIQEDAKDLIKRAEHSGTPIPEMAMPAARLLDLRKAYPRVNKPALWQILRKCGIGEKCLQAVQNLHETTTYKVKSREGYSEEWVPERGLREGCPTSPPLFNIFHQVVMRQASKTRKRKADESNMEVGICMKWIPGSAFPSGQSWEKSNSEAKRIRIERGLFADDTTVAGKKGEIEAGVNATKEVMAKFEEKNNDDKEEILEFGTAESDNIRMLGVWMGEGEDVKQRLKRAGAAWMKVKNQLRGSKLPKKVQARVVESCVENTLLFDCAVQTWRQSELRKLQSCMDKKYRTIWSRGTGPPLIQMQTEHKNMYDVRRELGVKSVRYKVEKRVLERIGHIMRMDDDRTAKAAVLGWLEDLEPLPKLPGKKRKTLLYWKQLLREAQIDPTNIASLTADRKEWKALVRARMRHIEEWERCSCHRVETERGARTSPVPDPPPDFVCEVDGCGRSFFNKAGLTIHRRKIHEISGQKVKFSCQGCGGRFAQEANLKNHLKSCSNARATNPNKKRCGVCGREVDKRNFARHVRNVCGAQNVGQVVTNTTYVAKRYTCESCGLEQAATNRSRHRRKCLGGP